MVGAADSQLYAALRAKIAALAARALRHAGSDTCGAIVMPYTGASAAIFVSGNAGFGIISMLPIVLTVEVAIDSLKSDAAELKNG